MKVSDKGRFALAVKEGLVPAPYLDSVGVWTWGIGLAETSGLEPNPRNMPRGMPADLNGAICEALRVFPLTLARYEADVNRAVKVPLAQHEFDALVSFHYNTGGIARAALTKSLNAGDKAGAARGFMGWLQPPEIRGRREAEQRLFREGVYPTGSIPVYSVTASNKPGRVIRSIGMAEALAMMGGAAQPHPAPTAPRPVPAPTTTPILRRGSRGDDVRRHQSLLGVTADGVFGPATEAAVRAFQRSHGLTADGVVGPMTWQAMTAPAPAAPATQQATGFLASLLAFFTPSR